MMDFVLCVSIDFYSIFILIASENMQKTSVHGFIFLFVGVCLLFWYAFEIVFHRSSDYKHNFKATSFSVLACQNPN